MEIKNNISLVSFLLRFGLAFSFIYVAIVSFITPSSWMGFLPDFVEIFVSKETALTLFSIFEILLGVSLLFNFKPFITSIISSIALFFITIFNLGAFDIVFRDVTIFVMSLTLNVITYKNNGNFN